MALHPEIIQWITSLNQNTFKGKPRPHKPVLLLAVLELAEGQALAENKVVFDPLLFEFSGEYWQALTDEPVGKIQYPFWHMDSEPFWALIPRTGFEEKLTRGKRYSPSVKQLREWVAYARLDEALYAAIQDGATRTLLRHLIISDSFADRQERVEKLRRFESDVYAYSAIIGKLAEGAGVYVAEPPPAPVRDRAFRRVVLEAYAYRCAVSGRRVSLPHSGGYELIQAAHIRDWSDSHDDSPRNGIALSPDYHWLFERGLFTVSTEYRIKISPAARDCIGSISELLGPFRNKPILLPASPQRQPDPVYLEWHRAHKFIH